MGSLLVRKNQSSNLKSYSYIHSRQNKYSMMFSGIRKKKDERKTEDGFFLKNGAAVLERLITLHNGVCNPIRSYSFQELKNATGDFRPKSKGPCYDLYKGVHEDHEVLVKKYTSKEHATPSLERIANEAAIASRMSNHKNVLKLLGCCLETEFPMLVYEFPTEGNLSSYIGPKAPIQLPWDQKLRIVTEIANAVAYLHHGLSKTIVYRDIKPSNVFLGQNKTAKLFNFEIAIPIPEGETHVDAEVLGTIEFIAPDLLVNQGSKARYTEKSDVYSFGILLHDVLLQKRLYSSKIWQTEASVIKICKKVQSDEFWEGIIAEYWKIYPQEENKVQVITDM